MKRQRRRVIPTSKASMGAALAMSNCCAALRPMLGRTEATQGLAAVARCSTPLVDAIAAAKRRTLVPAGNPSARKQPHTRNLGLVSSPLGLCAQCYALSFELDRAAPLETFSRRVMDFNVKYISCLLGATNTLPTKHAHDNVNCCPNSPGTLLFAKTRFPRRSRGFCHGVRVATSTSIHSVDALLPGRRRFACVNAAFKSPKRQVVWQLML